MAPSGKILFPSVFIVGLAKSGSSLLNRLMQPLCKSGGLQFSSPAAELRRRGLELRHAQVNFEPAGWAYGGFRGLPWPLPGFAAGRTVLLVRDPRDALTSLYFSVAYSHTPPGSSEGDGLLRQFEDQRARARAMSIDAFVLEEAAGHARLLEATAERIPAHRLYRYEDVVFDKGRWARDMLAYLDLSVAERRIDAIVARNDVLPQAEDPHAHVRRVTPGDHREKLAARTIAELDRRFADILRRFGYGP